MLTETFERLESNVRVYSRQYPTIFARARGTQLFDENGKAYLDFLANAGALNYGHNNPKLRAALLAYLSDDGVAQSLDMYTVAKRDFMEAFDTYLLKPRKLSYKMQFVGPTGTNAVEAALKLARKVTGRTTIAAFSNAFHGVSLGALSATANGSKRRGAHTSLQDVIRLPYDRYFGETVDTMAQIRQCLTDPSGGFDAPAAFIVETVQGEGGLNTISRSWYQQLVALAREIGALVIVDDIQSGCGRTGSFFSFEPLMSDKQDGDAPDIVCLSKSISGFGIPMSLVLLKPDLDIWTSGEHNGTFRGNNLAFVTATAAIEQYWKDDTFGTQLAAKEKLVRRHLQDIVALIPGMFVKGRGLMQGIAFPQPELATEVMEEAFGRGLIIETCGPSDEVIKLLPPLTTSEDELTAGLTLLRQSVEAVALRHRPQMTSRKPQLIAV
jgi:diaminobutyrate-2-oxoglutarate transaminase